MKWLCILLFGFAAVSCFGKEERIRAGVWNDPPFAFAENPNGWQGISVDVWEAAAGLRGWKFDYVPLPKEEGADALAAGKVDMIIPRLPLSSMHEKRFNFTHFYYMGGIGGAVRKNAGMSVFDMAKKIFSGQFALVVLSVAGTLLLAGATIWAVERKANAEHFGGAPPRGIGAGIWWAAVTLTTVGYGDKVPRTAAGRFLGAVWIFGSFFLVAAFTGHVSSLLTAHRLQSQIKNIHDVAQARVAVASNSPALKWAEKRGIKRRAKGGLQEALRALADGKADVVLEEEGLLKLAIASGWEDQGITVLPFMLSTEPCAFALREGNPIHEGLNQAILELGEAGTLPQIAERYVEAIP